jgi:molecular chaperone DnaK (HSP70)
MKLFQIEEPDGTPEGPGVAVGIDLDVAAGCAVAIAIGGNAELLPDSDGARRLPAPDLLLAGTFDAEALETVLLALRERAEKQLARPVTHAVIAADPLDAVAQHAIAAAAEAAELTVLLLVSRAAAAAIAGKVPAADAAVLGAAVEAENLAPTPINQG